MKLTVLASATLCLGVGLIASAQAHFGHKLDDAQCSAAWAKASPNGDPIGYTPAETYIVSFLITTRTRTA